MNIEIWTDGSYNKHNNKCASAFVIKDQINDFYYEKVDELFEHNTDILTTNVAEMSAIINALQFIVDNLSSEIIPETRIKITSDSQYCVKGISEWIHEWKLKSYRGKKNVDLWKRFYQLYYKSGFKSVSIEWVKGHSGVEENERCDRLCASITSTKNITL